MALKHNIGSICFQVINKERSYETIQEKERNPGSLFTEYVNIRARGKRELGKLSTAELYEVAGRHFERFLKGRTCRLRDVTATLIADFHCFLQKQRLRTNSINSYLSSLRAVYNAALSEGLDRRAGESFREARLKMGGDRQNGPYPPRPSARWRHWTCGNARNWSVPRICPSSVSWRSGCLSWIS